MINKSHSAILEGLSHVNEGVYKGVTQKLGIRSKKDALEALESLLGEWGITAAEVKKIYDSKVIALENGKTYTLIKDLFYMPMKTYNEFYEDLEFPENFLEKYTKGNNIVFSAGTKVKYYADRGGANFEIDGVDVPFNALEETLEDMGLTIPEVFK